MLHKQHLDIIYLIINILYIIAISNAHLLVVYK